MFNRLKFLKAASRSEKILAGVVVFSFVVLGAIFNTQFGLYLDLSEARCLPERLYVGYPLSGEIKRGDLVSFIADEKVMVGLFKGKRIVKQVAAIPGDEVLTIGGFTYINGRPIAKRNDVTLGRMALKNVKPVNVDTVLGPNQYMVLGTTEHSFDSRYWGVLDGALIDRKAKGVI